MGSNIDMESIKRAMDRFYEELKDLKEKERDMKIDEVRDLRIHEETEFPSIESLDREDLFSQTFSSKDSSLGKKELTKLENVTIRIGKSGNLTYLLKLLSIPGIKINSFLCLLGAISAGQFGFLKVVMDDQLVPVDLPLINELFEKSISICSYEAVNFLMAYKPSILIQKSIIRREIDQGDMRMVNLLIRCNQTLVTPELVIYAIEYPETLDLLFRNGADYHKVIEYFVGMELDMRRNLDTAFNLYLESVEGDKRCGNGDKCCVEGSTCCVIS